MQTQRQAVTAIKPIIVNIQQINKNIEQHFLTIHRNFKAYLGKKHLSQATKEMAQATTKALKEGVEATTQAFKELFGSKPKVVEKKTEVKVETTILTEAQLAARYDELMQPILVSLSIASAESLDSACKELKQKTNKDIQPIIQGVFDLYKQLISSLNELKKFNEEEPSVLLQQISEFHQLRTYVETPSQTKKPAPAPLERKDTLLRTFEKKLAEVTTKNRDITSGCEEIQAGEIEPPKCLLARKIETLSQSQIEFSQAVAGFIVDETAIKQAYKQKIHDELETKKQSFHQKALEHKQTILAIQNYLNAETKRQQEQQSTLQQLEKKLLTTTADSEFTQLEQAINKEYKHSDSSDSIAQLSAFINSVKQWTPSTHEDPLHGQDESIASLEQDLKTNLQDLTNTLTAIESFTEKFTQLRENYGELVLGFFDFANPGIAQYRAIINPLLKAISDLVVMTDSTEVTALKDSVVTLFQYISHALFTPLRNDSKQKEILTKYLMHSELEKMLQQNPRSKLEIEMQKVQTTAEEFKQKYNAISQRIRQQSLADITHGLNQARDTVLAELTSVYQFANQYAQLLKASQNAHTDLQQQIIALRSKFDSRQSLSASTVLSEKAPELAIKVETPPPAAQQTQKTQTPTSNKALLWTIFALSFLLTFFAGGFALLPSDTLAATILFGIGVLSSAGFCYKSILAADEASRSTSVPTVHVANRDEEVVVDVSTAPYKRLLDQPEITKGKEKEPIELTVRSEFKSEGQWNPRAVGKPVRVAVKGKTVESNTHKINQAR